jgi:hypothetical protein
MKPQIIKLSDQNNGRKSLRTEILVILLKLSILITSFITTITSLLICHVCDFPLTCLNLFNIIYWIGMKMAWHGKERHGMEMAWKWQCNGNGNGMAMAMAWHVKERQGNGVER